MQFFEKVAIYFNKMIFTLNLRIAVIYKLNSKNNKKLPYKKAAF